MISFGSVFLELVFGHVPELPRPGEEVFTEDFAFSCGGAVNSASAAARAGAHAGLCTVLGDDLGSRVVVEHCARAGVDLSPSVRVRRRSAGVTVVLNFGGDRAFVSNIPERRERQELDRWRAVLRRTRPRWSYLHGGPGVPGFLREARELGSKIALDVSLGDERDAADAIIECVRLADVFLPNEDEILRLTGTDDLRSALSVATTWGTPLVVTRGAAGAVIASPDGITEIADGVRQVTVRDLTGAGDAFAGAMIAALVRGVPLTGAVVAANAAGSEAVARLGAVGEVDVSGLAAVGQTLGARFIDQVAAAAADKAEKEIDQVAAAAADKAEKEIDQVAAAAADKAEKEIDQVAADKAEKEIDQVAADKAEKEIDQVAATAADKAEKENGQ